MCYFGEGRVKRCQHCSETQYQKLLLNLGLARSAHRTVATMAQHQSNMDHPQASRYSYHVDQYGYSTARKIFDFEQAPTQFTQPFSGYDAASVEMMPRKQQRANMDQASSSRHIQRTASSTQNIQNSHHVTSARPDVRAHNEGYQHLPSSSRHHTATTDLTSERSHSQTPSQSQPPYEDMEVVTPGMNKLPPPSWEDRKVISPLVRAQLDEEELHWRLERRLNDIWAMYGKEREALTAFQAPEVEETWTPEFEEQEDDDDILESEIPLWDVIWERSMFDGEASMRDILDEDKTRPQETAEELDIWTRETGGMLSPTVLRQLLRVLVLQKSLREEGVER